MAMVREARTGPCFDGAGITMLDFPDVLQMRTRNRARPAQQPSGSRLRTAERPVAPGTELLGDEIADHQVDAAAKDKRRHIGAEGGNKDQQTARDDAGSDSGMITRQRACRRCRIEVVGGSTSRKSSFSRLA